MVTLSPTTSLPQSPQRDTGRPQPGEYRLFWRRRASSPWRREEFALREEAFDRFFYLLGRGLQVRWRTLESR